MIRQTVPSKHIQVNSINSIIHMNGNTIVESNTSIVDVNEKHMQGTIWAGYSNVIIDPFDTFANISARSILSEFNLANCALLQGASSNFQFDIASNRTYDDGNSAFSEHLEGSANFSFADTSGSGNRLMFQAIDANKVIVTGHTQQMPVVKQYSVTVETDKVTVDALHSQYQMKAEIYNGTILIDNGKTRLEIGGNRTYAKIYGLNEIATFTSNAPYKIYFEPDSIRISSEEEEIVVNHNGDILSSHVETPSRTQFTNDDGFITMDRNQSVEGNNVDIVANSLTVQMNSKGETTIDATQAKINMTSPVEKVSINSKHSHLQSASGHPHLIINTNLTCVNMQYAASMTPPELWELQKPSNYLDYIFEEEQTITPFPFPPSFNVTPVIEICPPNGSETITPTPVTIPSISPSEVTMSPSQEDITPPRVGPNLGGSTSPTDFPFPPDHLPTNQLTTTPPAESSEATTISEELTTHGQITVHPAGEQPSSNTTTSEQLTSLTTEALEQETTSSTGGGTEWIGGVSTRNETSESQLPSSGEPFTSTISSPPSAPSALPFPTPFPTLIPDTDLTDYITETETTLTINGSFPSGSAQTEVPPSELPSSLPPGQINVETLFPTPSLLPGDYEELPTDFPIPEATGFELPGSSSTYYPPSNPFPEVDFPTPIGINISTSEVTGIEEPGTSSTYYPPSNPFPEVDFPTPGMINATTSEPILPTPPELGSINDTNPSISTGVVQQQTSTEFPQPPEISNGLTTEEGSGEFPTDFPNPSDIPIEGSGFTQEPPPEATSSSILPSDFPNPSELPPELGESTPEGFPIPSNLPPSSEGPPIGSTSEFPPLPTPDDFLIAQWGSTEPFYEDFTDFPQPPPVLQQGLESSSSSPRYLIFKVQIPEGVEVNDAINDGRVAMLTERRPSIKKRRLSYLENYLNFRREQFSNA